MDKVRAWTAVTDFGSGGITYARSRSRAKMRIARSIEDAGYADSVGDALKGIKSCVRAPDYDGGAKDTEGGPWTVEHAKRLAGKDGAR